MYKVRKLILIPILIFCISVIYLNHLRKDSFQEQKTLLSDLSNGEFNLTLNEMDNINTKYPSLAINTIPIKTLKSRYLNFHKRKNEANVLIDIALNENPYSVYSYYLKARILIEQNRNLKALDYLREAYRLSPETYYSTSIYVTLLGNFKLHQELLDIFPQIKLSSNWNIWNFYLLSLDNSRLEKNSQELNQIFSFARGKFKDKQINFNN